MIKVRITSLSSFQLILRVVACFAASAYGGTRSAGLQKTPWVTWCQYLPRQISTADPLWITWCGTLVSSAHGCDYLEVDCSPSWQSITKVSPLPSVRWLMMPSTILLITCLMSPVWLRARLWKLHFNSDGTLRDLCQLVAILDWHSHSATTQAEHDDFIPINKLRGRVGHNLARERREADSRASSVQRE